MPSTLDSLLQTKLRPPGHIGPVVSRPALLARLQQGLGGPLTLVCASAGYGKTSLVTQWLEACDTPAAWVSLDEDDAELGEFVTYLAAAIQQLFPESMTRTEGQLRSPEAPKPARYAKAFLQDLETLDGRIIVVLDDYHTIEDAATHSFMARLLQTPSPHLHFTLITRSDPILPLARLRSGQSMVEIRNADLRFRLDEARTLIEQIVGEPVDEGLIQQLETRTEGWAVGLQLAAVLLRATEDRMSFTRQFAHSGHRWIMQYLFDEALAKLDEQQRLILLRTALFHRFSANLLQHALVPPVEAGTGVAVLDMLIRTNLFLFPLDNEGDWYRFHHLFREMLRHRLHQSVPLAERQAMLRNASVWHEQNGLLDEAIDYALAANDHAGATRLVENHLNHVLNIEDWRRIDLWLRQLPPESINESPAALLAAAISEHFRHRIEATNILLDRAEAALHRALRREDLAEERRAELGHWHAAIYVFRSQQKHLADETEASIRFANDALKSLPQDWYFLRALAEVYRILGMQQAGRPSEAVDYARKRLNEERSPSSLIALRIFLGLGGVYYATADTYALQEVALAYHSFAQQLTKNISIGWACYMRGWAHYQRNELREAEQAFRTVVDICQLVHLRAATDSYTGLVLTLAAQNRFSEAQETTAQLRHYLTDLGAVDLLPVADSLTRRVALQQGENVMIPAMTDYRGQLQGDLLELPILTTVRAILHAGAHKRYGGVLEVLDTCSRWASKRHSTRRLIEIGLLTTMYHAVQEDVAATLDALRTVVDLAKPGGIVRPFVEMGIGLRPYLTLLLTRNFERGFVQEILAAYSPYVPPTEAELPSKAPTNGINGLPARARVKAELTHRELEVLALLAEKRSNAEIATALTVALPTVKKHSRNLYRKLRVQNRREAVARARVLGILSLEE